MEITKGKSPFYPGHPVPPGLFSGRQDEITRIERALNQTMLGKPSQAVFLQGEYGIGKSSLAGIMSVIAERKYFLFPIQVLLGGTETIDEMSERVLITVLESEYYEPDTKEKVRNFLAKYIGSQSLFGVTLKIDELKKDAPHLSRGFLPFLKQVFKELQPEGIKGIVLILDELNGITSNPKFSFFIKNLNDENALSKEPLPLLLMLCGVSERRKEMIMQHQPIDRIFEIIKVNPLSEAEMKSFFEKSFASVNCQVNTGAMEILCRYSAGFPKVMHIIGDNVFWMDKDNLIDEQDATRGIFKSAQDIGEQFLEEQVIKALKSPDYIKILKKIATGSAELNFFKNQVENDLTASEKEKFTNFLHKMKKLNVLQSGEERGEYVFQSRLTKLYIWLKSAEK